MRLPLTHLFAFLFACAIAPAALAQGVSGAVRDSLTQLPLPGAVVILTDAQGVAVARAVTDRQGVYRLPAAPAGARLRVLRLGFHPRELPLAAADQGGPRPISLIGIPLLLETVRTVAAASCPRRADREAALSLLEQVRAGLLSAIVARANSTPMMHRIRYERRRDARGALLRQQVRIDAAAVDRAYAASRDAAGFVRDGFLEDSTRLYFAPEAETLVDPAFAGGYCFHVMPPDSTRPHQVGLGFRAAKRRRGRVDIDGALWVDSTARVLTDLEFRYVGLPREVERLSPGGRLAFTEMPNGIPLISGWSIRLASLQPASRGAEGAIAVRDAGGRQAFMRMEIDETGGQLADATWPDGTSWRAPLATVRLRAASPDGRPAPGRRVRLLDTDYEASTDSAGVAEIRSVLPGRYTAAVVDSQLAMLGIVLAAPSAFTAEGGATVNVAVNASSATEYMTHACAGAGMPVGASFVLGRAVLPNGASAAGAEWSIHGADGSALAEGGQVGADGLIHWCSAPAAEPATITVSFRGRVAQSTHVLAPGLNVVRIILEPLR